MTKPATGPKLCRVDYLAPDGTWWRGHGGINLMDPAGYAARLTRPGRVTELNDDLTEGTVHLPPDLAELEDLL